ncbi:hypothetical protein [Marilutibacter aestuarii]|uniref:DUF5666 domain-containing protein n=1 Tax=Marilutibacter aestuarii TaxID=1706195 RepID=A0A508ABK0_9GAMM|nr:hypothetical protein [Lysobacter aestuarii]TQD44405.1 hypothetical protein FKV25_09475 [Lysobacter aestuarii]
MGQLLSQGPCPASLLRKCGLLVVALALTACATGSGPVANGSAGKAFVGTVARIDMADRRLALADDSRTGNALGQGASTHLRFDADTPVREAGRAVPLAGLAVGDRVRVEAGDDGTLPMARRIDVLHAPDAPLPWGRYVHGRIVSINTRSRTVNLAQAGTNLSVRVRYEADTSVVDLQGAPIDAAGLVPGDEVDVVLRVVTPDPVALKVTRLR